MAFQQDPFYIHIILEFVPGGEFFSYLKKVNRVSREVASFYASQIVLAFEYLHSFSIVYRDLKPENLLIGINGYLKVADFGFAKLVKNKTYTICGTPDYIPPEVLMNSGHGCAADWWSLGILIYEMMTGVTPFSAENPMAMYDKIIKGEYRFPKGLNRHAKSLIGHLLQGDLSQRYGNI